MGRVEIDDHEDDYYVWVGAIVRTAPGVALDVIPIDELHDCGEEPCVYRPSAGRASEARWIARRLLSVVGAGRGPITDTDRRSIACAAALLGAL